MLFFRRGRVTTEQNEFRNVFFFCEKLALVVFYVLKNSCGTLTEPIFDRYQNAPNYGESCEIETTFLDVQTLKSLFI